MREAERDKQRLEDILEAIDYAQSFVEGLTFEEFQKDKRTIFCCC